MSITRRDLFRTLGGLCAWASLPELVACGPEADEVTREHAFLHGVASGDPLSDAVVLWTRVTPRTGVLRLALRWELAADTTFAEVIARGTAETSAERDFTVKVEADGLEAGTVYYYRFFAEHVSSAIGRTRTAVAGSVERLRFAVVSCSNYAQGYFHGYRSVSERLDLDAVIHLGDYIYEHGNGEYGWVRDYEPAHELFSLADYRQRYAQYRCDPDLQALHQQLPMIAIWDDHEFANDAWLSGAQNHNPELGEGAFAPRRAAAARAYLEWMPIREQPDSRVFRRFAFGDLVDLIMLDTRMWGRSQQVLSEDDPTIADPKRTLLGEDQEAWLGAQLTESSACWRLIGQQIMVGLFPVNVNLDAWRGYPAARARLLEQLRAAAGDCVILSGDVHSSWAMNVIDQPFDPSRYDPESGQGSYAVELVTPGITSPLLDQATAEAMQPMLLAEPHIKYAQAWRRGYMILDVDRARVQAAWYHYDAVDQPDPVDATFGGAAAVYSGERRIRIEREAAPSGTTLAQAAPSDVRA